MSSYKEAKKVTDKNVASQEQDSHSRLDNTNILQDRRSYLTNDTVTSVDQGRPTNEMEKERIAKDEKTTASDRKGTLRSRTDLEQLLRTRAHKDETFRQDFLANPRAVLERDYPDYFPGGKVPDGKVIKVTEEDEQTLHLVLPPKSSDILSDIRAELLKGVQGGVNPVVGGLDRIGLSPLRGTRDRSGMAGRGDTGNPDNDLCSSGCNA